MNPICTRCHTEGNVRIHLEFNLTAPISHIKYGIRDNQSILLRLPDGNHLVRNAGLLGSNNYHTLALVKRCILFHVKSQRLAGQCFRPGLFDPVSGDFNIILDIRLHLYDERACIRCQVIGLCGHNNAKI